MSKYIDEDHIGERIKAARLSKNISQRALGEKCGMKDSQISDYENGKKKPYAYNLARIALALDVSTDELIFGSKSEAYINSAEDNAETIVRCFYKLWEMGGLNKCRTYGYGNSVSGHAGMLGVFIFDENADILDRLCESLDDFKRNIDTYPGNEDKFVKLILDSAVNSIRKREKK